MMRIAFVNQDPGTGPTRKKGAAVHVRAMRSAFEHLGAKVHPIDDAAPGRVRGRLEELLAHGELDLVYERYSLQGYAGARFCREHGVPHFLEVNAPLADEARRFRPDSDLATDPEEEHALFAGAHVFAVSRATAAYAVARGALESRVKVMPNAVDPRLFRPRADDTIRARHVPPGRFVLGIHGRFRPWHNLPMLIEATRVLVARGLPAFLMVVGYGDGVERLGELPASSYTHLPWCDHDEVADLVACFDALPLTYAPQNDFYFSPLKLLEAMACGVVPVVPDLGDLTDRVDHGGNGLVYPAGDRSALVAVLAGLVEDRTTWSSLRIGAIETARRSTWLHVARSVLDPISEKAG